MKRWSPPARLRVKLLLSYLLVLAIAFGALVLAVRLIAPSRFDRLLAHQMGHGMMAGTMNTTVQQATKAAFQDALAQALIVSVILASLVAIGVSLFVTERITGPIRRLATASHRIAQGDYGARVTPAEPDEIGELAESFNQMAEALESTERRRVELIGDVAHELRTPVATLQGYLEGLADGVVTPSEELWRLLQDQTGRMHRLIEDLQELSRVESGMIPLQRGTLAPLDLVNATISSLAPHFEAKGIILQVSMPTSLPNVWADRDRSVQILTNLLTNALRYTPNGGNVTVTAAAADRAVRFQVRDTGIGIPSENLARLFDRFYRADPSRSRALGGSGVGLTIARALVEAQSGKIWAESAGPNQGSTFSFTLPTSRQ